MIEPPLDEAIGALREEESLAPGDALGTRSRVLATLGRRRQQRQVWLVAGMVLACCLVGTTSWAWVTGWLPARLGLESQPIEQVSSSELGNVGSPAGSRRAGAEPLEPAADPAAEIVAPPVPSAPAIAPPVPSAPAIAPPAPIAPAIAPPVPSAPAVAPPKMPVPPKAPAHSLSRPGPPAKPPVAAPPRTVEPTSAPVGAPSAETVAPAPDPELAAFRRAHEAHFGGGEPLAVLALWDDYLSRFAAGRLAPEARWNRAVLLVRLGRTSEARAALAPFAAGAESGYRQREAEELMRTLP